MEEPLIWPHHPHESREIEVKETFNLRMTRLGKKSQNDENAVSEVGTNEEMVFRMTPVPVILFFLKLGGTLAAEPPKKPPNHANHSTTNVKVFQRAKDPVQVLFAPDAHLASSISTTGT